MTAAEAMIDAALTIRVWQREGLEAAEIASQLRCAADWNAVESAIVIDLLMGRDAEALCQAGRVREGALWLNRDTSYTSSQLCMMANGVRRSR